MFRHTEINQTLFFNRFLERVDLIKNQCLMKTEDWFRNVKLNFESFAENVLTN